MAANRKKKPNSNNTNQSNTNQKKPPTLLPPSMKEQNPEPPKLPPKKDTFLKKFLHWGLPWILPLLVSYYYSYKAEKRAEEQAQAELIKEQTNLKNNAPNFIIAASTLVPVNNDTFKIRTDFQNIGRRSAKFSKVTAYLVDMNNNVYDFAPSLSPGQLIAEKGFFPLFTMHLSYWLKDDFYICYTIEAIDIENDNSTLNFFDASFFSKTLYRRGDNPFVGVQNDEKRIQLEKRCRGLK
ncbi:hypothetical protein [Foetidibacter luteolus]|uniref:hypothetical protein n=1 Tax=Foetidibacter luteolus TaxID=2608880 RepID=UPI00129B1599|nr:hypothetical protein [Foetidibacter luteolus]